MKEAQCPQCGKANGLITAIGRTIACQVCHFFARRGPYALR